jgi:hypothetical protein
MIDIRANTVLPAERRDVVLHTADGLELVGELALPLDRPPVATIVCLHPLPTEGGFMDSHLLKKASYRLPALAGSGRCCASTPAARPARAAPARAASTPRWARSTTSPRRWTCARPRTCRRSGWSAGRSAPTSR